MSTKTTDLRCRACSSVDMIVSNSRVVHDSRLENISNHPTVRRSRKCLGCGHTSTTLELHVDDLGSMMEKTRRSVLKEILHSIADLA